MPTQKKNELTTSNWVVKSNELNEIKNSRMTISQIRLFSIYLSKINPKDISTREVTFKLSEYAKVMQFQRFNITQLKQTASDLLDLTVKFNEDRGGFKGDGFTLTSSLLFKRFKLYKDNDDEWVVTINCHDDVMGLMFELQKHYFKYELWNALQLPSPNQQRMYELLKQYERAGAREITVKDLREFLGLQKDEHPRWDNFRRRILEAAQVALANHTDIKFTWEPIRRGRGGKVTAVKFNIEKNHDYMRQLTFDEFIQEQHAPEMEDTPDEFELENDSTITFLSDACNDEFSLQEIRVLYNLIIRIIPHRVGEGVSGYQIRAYDYLKHKYDELLMQASRREIKNRFGYLKKIIEVE